MIDTPYIRVWLIGTAKSDFLKPLEHRAKPDDIILLYDTRIRGISHIGGYRKEKLQLPNLVNAVRDEAIETALWPSRDVVGRILNGESIFLTANDWHALRRDIIDSNPELEQVIDELEAAQQRLPELASIYATAYDLVYSVIKAFEPAKMDIIIEKLDDWRRNISSSISAGQPPQSSSPINSITDSLVDSGLASRVDVPPDSYQEKVAEKLREKYSESDSIQRDFRFPGLGLEQFEGVFEPEVEDQMVMLRDVEDNRQLMLYMAHRKGVSERDLVAADLIYENTDLQSLVFVQYKRANSRDAISLKEKHNQEQLQMMLETCRVQGCPHSADGGRLTNSAHIRLGACPCFYKFIANKPKISPASKSIEGVYVQACLVDQLSRELGEPLKRKEDLSRALSLSVFSSLLRKAHIGSKAESFDKLRDRILVHMGQSKAPLAAYASQSK